MDQLHYLKGEKNGVTDSLSRVQLQPKEKMAANCIVAAVSASDEQDILPEEGWPQAVQEEALVDDTSCVRGSVPPSVVSNQVPHANEANYSPIPSTITVASDSPSCCVAGATHRSVTPSNTVDYASSAWACSAIFVPDPTTVAALPTPSEVRVAQERD